MGVVSHEGASGGRCPRSPACRAKCPDPRLDQGFTLIELVIVIAIAVVLMAITVPTYILAREQQRRLTCSTNLQQVYTALKQYYDDEQGFPPGYRPGHPGIHDASDPEYRPDYGAVATLLTPGYQQLRRATGMYGFQCPDDRVMAAQVADYYCTYSEYYNYWGYDPEGLPYTAPLKWDNTPKNITVPPSDPYYRNPVPEWDTAGPWPEGVQATPKWDFFPKLGNEYYDVEADEWRANRDHTPPPSTIVTRCRHHHGRKPEGLELVLHLDGSYGSIQSSDWKQPDGIGYPFEYQPKSLGKR